MDRYRFVVLSNPVEGQEAEFNEWYSNRHIQDVVETPGFVGAERFERCPVEGDNCSHGYLAIYEMDAENPEEAAAALQGLFARGKGGAMSISKALDTSTILSGVFRTMEGATAP